MAVTNPKKTNLTSYRGNSFSFLYTFSDEAGADIDLATDYTDIQFRVFKSGSKSSPEIDLTIGDGLTIQNTNEIVGAITAAQTEALPQTLFYEILFTLADGTKEVYLFGRFFVENYQSATGEVSAEYTITINQSTNEVTFAESYDAAAKAVAAKVDAETAQTAAEAAQTAAETAETGAETAESNAATSATNASNSATAAATSETNAAASETAAETAEQNTIDALDQTTVDNAGYYVNELSVRHKIGEPLLLPEAVPSDIVSPPTGYVALFIDTDNSNALSKKDSSGTTTAI